MSRGLVKPKQADVFADAERDTVGVDPYDGARTPTTAPSSPVYLDSPEQETAYKAVRAVLDPLKEYDRAMVLSALEPGYLAATVARLAVAQAQAAAAVAMRSVDVHAVLRAELERLAMHARGDE